jgi:hypothetical protein
MKRGQGGKRSTRRSPAQQAAASAARRKKAEAATAAKAIDSRPEWLVKQDAAAEEKRAAAHPELALTKQRAARKAKAAPEGARQGMLYESGVDAVTGRTRQAERRMAQRLAIARKTGRLDLGSEAAPTGFHFDFMHVPPEIFAPELQGLHTLWLSNNRISSLTCALRCLSGLRTLGLAGNRIAHLPPDVCLALAPSLERLCLAGNVLASLPPEIGRMRRLTELSLDGNHLHAFAPELLRLPALARLTLSRNKIAELPAQMGRMVGLVELALDDNLLEALPESLRHCAMLRTLGLANNRLGELPAWLPPLRLDVLRLSGNRKPGYVVRAPDGAGKVDAGPVLVGANVPTRPDGFLQLVQPGSGAPLEGLLEPAAKEANFEAGRFGCEEGDELRALLRARVKARLAAE